MGEMRKRFGNILVVASAVFLLVVMSGVFATADEIRYGGQYYPGEFVLKGYPELWGELAIEHILFSSGTENNMALISGAIDINVGSDSKSAALFAAIDNALIIGVLQRGDRYSTIVRVDAEYNTWHDLKGKTVGTRLGTGAEQVLLRYFDSVDLSWDDFVWVNVKVEDMTATLDAGQIEAFTAWEPTPAIAEAQGIGRVLMSYGDVALVPVSIHTTVEYAESHRAELVAFLQVHLRKVALIESDPWLAAWYAAQAASAMGSEVSPMAFYTIFGRVDFSMGLTDDVIAALEDTAWFLYERGKIDCTPEFRWDASFLEDAHGLD